MRNVDRWTNWLRQQEFDAVKKWFITANPAKTSVLEIGGGNGFLAKCISDMGFAVVSIDPQPREPSYSPVRAGDSTSLEFEDKSFDIIFSSHVLPFITGLDGALSEMKRVLKDSGFMVHIVPTCYSTIFTLLLQPAGYLIQAAFMLSYGLKSITPIIGDKNSEGSKVSAEKSSSCQGLNKQNIYKALKILNPVRFFITWPLPANKNWLAEIRDWRQDVWCRCFEQAGLKVKEIIPLPLAYSRHAVLPFRFVKLRRWLAKQSKSTAMAFVVHC
jgi:ubiquinone/menaquinone biosynthesis C-methylase UbiE